MNTSDLELALRIKSDMAQARADVRGLRDDIKGVDQATGSARSQANAYTEQMSRLQSAAVGASKQSKNLTDALTLMNKIDPVGNKLDRLDALESELNRLHKAGAIGADDFNHLGGILAAQRNKLFDTGEGAKGAAKGLNLMAFASGQAAREYGVLAGELARGNYTRLEGSFITLSNRVGLLPKLFTGVGLAIGGVIAVLGLSAAAFIEATKQDDAFNRALASTGSFGTTSAGQLDDLVDQIGATTRSYSNAAEALTSLTGTGRYTTAQLGALTQTAVELAAITGGKMSDAVKQVNQLMGDSKNAIADLDKQYHFLSATQFDQIQQLQAEGREDEARAIAQQAFSQQVHQRALEVRESTNLMAKGWDWVKQHAEDAWHSMEHAFQAQSIAAQRADAIAQLQRAQGTHLDRAGNLVQNASPEAIAALQAKVRDLTTQLVQQGIRQTAEQVNQNAETKAKAAAQYLAQFKTPIQELQEAEISAGKALDDFLLGKHSPEAIKRAYDQFHQAIDQAVSNYQSSQKKPKSALSIDRAQLAADVAAVQNSLKRIGDAYGNADKVLEAQHKAGLISDRAYYDGLRADLDKYETDKVAALEKEKTAATSHIKTAEDRIRADQKVAQIDQQITQVHADAAAKRLQIDAQEQAAIQKSDAAWQEFLQTLATPAEINLDDALAKIDELNAGLKNGRVDAQQYQDILSRITQQSIASVPSSVARFQRHSDNPLAQAASDENFDYQSDTAQLAAQFTQELALSQGGYAQLQAAAETFYTSMEQRAEQHAETMAAIKRAEAASALTTTAGLFGQLATLSSSHNRKVAEIGKAAAIAQAIITTYQNATVAYGEGLVAGGPYAGPAVGAVFAAIAIAAGLANVAAIRSQPIGGYAGGGAIRGAGTKTSDSVPILASDGEFMQRAAAVDYYGLDFMHAVNNLQYPKFADGGPIGDAPRLTAPALATPRLSSPNASGGRGFGSQPMKFVLALNDEQLADHLLNTSAGERAVVVHVGNHPQEIQAKWGSG